MKTDQRCKSNVRSNRSKHKNEEIIHQKLRIRPEHKSWNKQVKEIIKKMWQSQRTKERKAETKTKKPKAVQPRLELATNRSGARRVAIPPSENCMTAAAKTCVKPRLRWNEYLRVGAKCQLLGLGDPPPSKWRQLLGGLDPR